MRDPDVPSLVAGIALVDLGSALVADGAGVLDLGFAVAAPAMCAVLGAILLALGLSRGA